MANSINSKAKEYYDNDDTGGSLNSNLKDFLVQQGATGKSINTLWRDYAYGEGGTSLNTRLRNLWGTSGSLMKRWKETLGLTWDEVKAFFNFRDIEPDFLLDGSTSFDGTDDYIDLDAHIGDFSSQTTGTISLWFKTSSDSASMSFISASDWGDASSNFSILCNVKKIQLNIRENGTDTIDAVGSVDYNDNKWHHLAFAVDGSGNKMYIDGSQIALTYSTGSASTQS